MNTLCLAAVLSCVLAGLVLACGKGETPSNVNARSATALPPVAAVAPSDPVGVGDLELSGTPVAPAGLAPSVGLGHRGGYGPSPTLALVDGMESAPGDAGGATVVPALVNESWRLSCTIVYRQWLIEAEWIDARDLDNYLPDFRRERPDCDGEKFNPVFSNLAVCQHRKRVGGVVVASDFTGPATASSLGLSITRKSSVGMLIHFRRLPTLENRGCWYYLASEDYWVQGVVDDVGRDLGPGGTPAIDGGPSFLECDSELQERLASMDGLVDAGDVQALVDRIAGGYGSCNLGWGAVASPERLWPGCPDDPTGRDVYGRVTVHWSAPPSDGAACWIYDAAAGSWESIGAER